MNQAELRKMAEERLKDAKAILDGGRWEFAYYTAGYAVECGLKSCILARMIYTGWVFVEKWDARLCLVHEFGKLADIAGLTDELNAALKAPAGTGSAFVNNWTVTSRYDPNTEADARARYAAIADEPNGVLRWIRTYW